MPAQPKHSQPTKRPAKARLNAVALGVALTVSSFALAQQNLPSMGEPADNALSPIEEKQLGKFC